MQTSFDHRVGSAVDGTQQPVRAAIYARYSCDMQRPASIEDQIRNCRQEAERNGWIVLDSFVRSDSAQSGSSLIERRALISLLEDARKKPRPFDCIVIDDTSRLGRNLPDVLSISDKLKHCEVFLRFVSKRLDSRDPMFRSQHTLDGLMDEQFLTALAEKVHRGQEGRILHGFHPGGRCYGYRNVPVEDHSRRGKYGRAAIVGVRLEIVEEQAAVVRRIYEMYPIGYSLSGIAKKLNAEGVPPPEHQRRAKALDAWMPGCVRDILNNERYVGRLIWNKTQKIRNPETGRRQPRKRPESEWVTTECLKIVSEEQWVRVQNQRKLVNEKWGFRRFGGINRSRRTYLFSGLLRCGVCGGQVAITGGSKQYPVYSCYAHRYCGKCPNALRIRQETLENQLIAGIVNRILRPDVLEHAIASFGRKLRQRMSEMEAAARESSAQSPQLNGELEGLRKQASNIADAIAADGCRQSPTLLSRLGEIETRIREIQTRLEKPKVVNKLSSSIGEVRNFVLKKAGDLRSVLAGDPVLAKDNLRKHVRELVLTPKQTPSGPVFDVSGDVDLFGGDPSVMLMVPGGGIEPPRTEVRRILSPLRLPVPPSRPRDSFHRLAQSR